MRLPEQTVFTDHLPDKVVTVAFGFGCGFGFGQKLAGAVRSLFTNLSFIKLALSVGNFAVLANNTAAACVRLPQIPSATPALHPAALSSF